MATITRKTTPTAHHRKRHAVLKLIMVSLLFFLYFFLVSDILSRFTVEEEAKFLSHEEEHGQQGQHLLQQVRLQDQNEEEKGNLSKTMTCDDEKKSNDKDGDFVFHIVFSSGCNALQDWQSYMFFHQIMASGFMGNVTRVASCDTIEQANKVRQLHQEQIQSIMSDNFRLHITPSYAHVVPNVTYSFFNKPFGIRRWMRRELNFPQQLPDYERTIFVLMDPDQFLIRQFHQDMRNEPELWTDTKLHQVVDQGKPMAARYALGGRWVQLIDKTQLLALSPIQDGGGSGLHDLTPELAIKYYAVGPPYVVQANDMWKIVCTWADFVRPIHNQLIGDNFLAEMFAYSAAAAHLNLPHQVVGSFMVSNPEIDSEGWPSIDTVPNQQVVMKERTNHVGALEVKDGTDTYEDHTIKTNNNICSLDFAPVPHVIHFCQRYYLGPFFLYKHDIPRRLPDDMFLSCEHPLFQEPPLNVMELYNWGRTLDGKHVALTEPQRRRMAFVLCQLLPRMNAAATFYKQHHCSAPGAANYDKVFVFETYEAKRERLERKKLPPLPATEMKIAMRKHRNAEFLRTRRNSRRGRKLGGVSRRGAIHSASKLEMPTKAKLGGGSVNEYYVEQK